MVASGIPPLAAMLTSLLVFAGASMVASAQLLASGTPALLHERLLAGVVAIAMAWRWRTTFATIIAGLLALHLFGLLR